MYYCNRMYQPQIGRFLWRDPAGYPNNPDGNLYAYCSNSVTVLVDPMGLGCDGEEGEENEPGLIAQIGANLKAFFWDGFAGSGIQLAKGLYAAGEEVYKDPWSLTVLNQIAIVFPTKLFFTESRAELPGFSIYQQFWREFQVWSVGRSIGIKTLTRTPPISCVSTP